MEKKKKELINLINTIENENLLNYIIKLVELIIKKWGRGD